MMPLKLTFIYLYRFILVMALSPLLASASQLRPENTDTLFQQHTQQQQAQQQQFDAKAPDVSLSVPAATSQWQFPDETPCFLIEHPVISGQEALPRWVPVQRLANQAVDHCVGVQGINHLVADMQNRLISHGWITTRVLVPEQDLSSGKGSSFGVGDGTDGFSLNARMSQGKGVEQGSSQFYTDTEINAGKQLTLNSGQDTMLTGAQVSGETIRAHIGGGFNPQ